MPTFFHPAGSSSGPDLKIYLTSNLNYWNEEYWSEPLSPQEATQLVQAAQELHGERHLPKSSNLHVKYHREGDWDGVCICLYLCEAEGGIVTASWFEPVEGTKTIFDHLLEENAPKKRAPKKKAPPKESDEFVWGPFAGMVMNSRHE